MSQRLITSNVQETEHLGFRLAQQLNGNEVIALYGGLGIGKTAFVRGLAKGLRVEQEVSSPTFALIHHYQGRYPVYHFDMYRVEGWDDLYSTGFFDYLDGDGVLVIEWSENIEGALPDNVIRIHIKRGEKDCDRIFHMEGVEKLFDCTCH